MYYTLVLVMNNYLPSPGYIIYDHPMRDLADYLVTDGGTSDREDGKETNESEEEDGEETNESEDNEELSRN